MSDKITLATVGSLIDATTAANTINSNFATIEINSNNNLSRDGTQPNTMLAPLDMNSNKIINLPAPSSANEPIRVTDLNTFAGGGTITVQPLPSGGTTGQVLAKNSVTNFDASWNSSGMPTGGTVNQILKKNSSTDYDTSWANPNSAGLIAAPVSSTDKAAVRFNGTSGTSGQNSALIIADTTGALSRSGGGGIPIQGMGSNAAAVAAGNIGEYISNQISIAGGFSLTSGSGGQVWNTITLTAGTWLLLCQSGVYSSSGTATFTHMHSGMGVGMTSIPTSPTFGTAAMHVTSNNPNGWIIVNNPYPVYLPSGGTVNACLTSDFTGGTAIAYGTLAALRIA